MHPQKIFLTGATGFLGSHIAKKLILAGHQVHALCRREPNSTLPIQWHIGDLKDPDSLKKAIATSLPDVVIHCAAFGIRHHERSHEELININIQGTASLMTIASEYGVKRWIQTGSCSEYPSQREPLSETVLTAPPNFYGVTKTASSLLALQQGQALSMDVTVLRLFGIYGPSEWPERLIPTLLSACLTEKEVSFTSGYQSRDFVYVEEVADLYTSLATTPHFPNGEIFNIGSGIATTVREVGRLTEMITGKSGYFLWGTKSHSPTDLSCWVADIAKSQKILNWQPKISLEEGIIKTMDTMRTLYAV